MKAVILGAGRGTRLRPLTNYINKILIPVYDKPVVQHALEVAKKAGISQIALVVQERELDWWTKKVVYFEDDLSLSITVLANDKWATAGMAGAVYIAKDFVGQDNFVVIPGDNAFSEDLSSTLNRFESGAMVHKYWVDDPSRFGVAVMNDKEEVIDIIEKPKNPPSNWALMSPHVFDYRAFQYIEESNKSERGEYEITDILKRYMKDGELQTPLLPGKIFDIGDFDSLLEASNFFKDNT